MGAWTPYSGAAVITAATGAWQDCDLSAIVGTNTAVVLLQMTGSGPLMVRPKGGLEREDLFAFNTGTKGCHAGQSSGTNYYLITKTDSSGVLQFIDPDLVGWTANVFLVGFFVPSNGVDAVVYGGLTLINNTWKQEPVHADHIPPAGRTALFQQRILGFTNNISLSTRPSGETADYWKANGGRIHKGASGCVTWFDSILAQGGYSPIVCEVDSSGYFDIIANLGGSLVNEAVTQWSECEYYTKKRVTIFTDHVVPVQSAGWETVDLSSYIGSIDAMAVFRMSVGATSGISSYGAVRQYGQSANFTNGLTSDYGAGIQQIGYSAGEGGIVICPTDSQGRAQIAATIAGKKFDLEMLGFVGPYLNTPPVVDTGSIEPSGSVVRVSAPQTIAFRLTDPSGSGIPISSLSFKAVDQIGREIPLITAGVVASGLTGYIAPADSAGIAGDPIDLQVHIDWPSSILSGQRYDMTVDATNNVGESL